VSSRIEDYAFIGDLNTGALVSREGSIDWACLPRFDSAACFAALLGTPEHGRWQIYPVGEVISITRRYREGTLILETEYETADGVVVLVDCMLPQTPETDIARLVVGKRGRVAMKMQLVIRYEYGVVVPWVVQSGGRLTAVAGPDALCLDAGVPVHGENLTTVAEFTVGEGEVVPFGLHWHESYLPAAERLDTQAEVGVAEAWWREWSSKCTYQGPHREAVVRSLVTLKGLIYAPTGGIVAAATTSLPELIGGVRNWDYRFCWLRDATFSLLALMAGGYTEEAVAFRDWLLRAVAGDPAQLQIMYGAAGERRLTETTLPWLPGYEGSLPVRIGNAAASQFQLDVYGEVMDAMFQARKMGAPPQVEAWHLEKALLRFLDTHWSEPDEGIWEVRGPRRHFTHSKVMAWVAYDRAIKSVETFGMADGCVDAWRAMREKIHAEICERGVDKERGVFVQYYGGKELDASLLMIPLLGFLPARDPRVVATVEAIEKELVHNGLVLRYLADPSIDGLPAGEATFIMCSFWLVDCLALMGRQEDAEALFERLLALRNDVGLLAEEYDVSAQRLLGNFPQAFSHVALVNAACTLARSSYGPESRGA
jgi:GH15 family glucan-1,4-alpha-glucosidase